MLASPHPPFPSPPFVGRTVQYISRSTSFLLNYTYPLRIVVSRTNFPTSHTTLQSYFTPPQDCCNVTVLLHKAISLLLDNDDVLTPLHGSCASLQYLHCHGTHAQTSDPPYCLGEPLYRAPAHCHGPTVRIYCLPTQFTKVCVATGLLRIATILPLATGLPSIVAILQHIVIGYLRTADSAHH